MYTIQIKITNIDYEKNFHAIYPLLEQKLEQTKNPPLLARFLKQMDGDAENIVWKLLSILPQEELNNFLVTGLNIFREKLTETLNSRLPNIPRIGQISVSDMFAQLDSTGAVVLIGQDLKYDGHSIGEASGMQALMEKFVITILKSDNTKNLLLDISSQALKNFGLAMGLKELQVYQCAESLLLDENNAHLTTHQKEVLVDVLAKFLKESI